jgi:hypothetical protein
VDRVCACSHGYSRQKKGKPNVTWTGIQGLRLQSCLQLFSISSALHAGTRPDLRNHSNLQHPSTPQHEHVSPVDTLIRKLNTPPTQHRVGEDLESLPELPRNSQIRRNATLRLAERLGNRRGTHATCDSDNVLLKSTYGLLSPLPAGYRASRVSVRLPRHRPVEPYEADVSDLL